MKARITSFLLANTLFAMFTFSIDGWAQQKYLSFDEIQFTSDLERKTLKNLIEGEGDILTSFLVISIEDSSQFVAWKGVYDREMTALKNRKKSKKLSKDVKYVYDQLHSTFLTKYQLMSLFDQIFEDGVYNCVTAVALYAMAFEEVGIPYHIKETPTHVYIIADPDESQLLIETTDPVSGFKSFRPGFKEQFVAQLGMLKLVNENDIASKGIFGVFDEFYFGGAKLSLTELVGIQYYNQGVYLFNEKDYHGAWHALTKAQLFHDNKQITNMLLASLGSVLSYSDYSDWSDVMLIPYMERFLEHDIKETNVIGEFQRMLNFVLLQNNEDDKAKMAYEHFMAVSKNENLKNEITFAYRNEVAIRAYNRGNYFKAYHQSTKAYTAKPGNVNAETMLIEAFRMAYQDRTSQSALVALDTLIKQNPEIVENNRINTLRLNLFLEVMGDKFDARKATEGNELRSRFEEAVTNNPNFRYDRSIVGNAYSKAAVYYFKRGYTSKARSIIRTGLKYAPDNYQLKSRLSMLNY